MSIVYFPLKPELAKYQHSPRHQQLNTRHGHNLLPRKLQNLRPLPNLMIEKLRRRHILDFLLLFCFLLIDLALLNRFRNLRRNRRIVAADTAALSPRGLSPQCLSFWGLMVGNWGIAGYGGGCGVALKG